MAPSSFPYADRLMADRDNLTGMAHEVAERAAKEKRDLTESERGQIAQWQERCADIDSQLATHTAALESERSYAELRKKISERPALSDGDGNGRKPAPLPVIRGWGETFVESDQFRSYETGSSGRVEMPGSVLSPFELRQEDVTPMAPGDPITTTGLRMHPQRVEAPTPAYRTPLLDVCGRERVSLNQVDWVKWGPTPMNAAGGPIAEGAIKPGADITSQVVTVTLETYAHWQALTRQALEDVPRIRSIVEGKLRQGIIRKLEEGTGAAINASTAGIPPAPGAATDWLLANIRKGMALVGQNGYTANAVLLNPQDWAEFDIDIMGGTLNGPVVGRTFWGLTPVSSPAVASGTAFVGDFRTGVTMFERSSTSVYLTDSHADYMTRNLLLILAETRALPVVVEPMALAKATGDPGRPTPDPGNNGGGNGEARRAKAAA